MATFKAKLLITGVSLLLPAMAIAFTPTSPNDFGLEWIFHMIVSSCLIALTLGLLLAIVISKSEKSLLSLSVLVLTAGGFTDLLYLLALINLDIATYGGTVFATTAISVATTMAMQIWLFAARRPMVRKSLVQENS